MTYTRHTWLNDSSNAVLFPTTLAWLNEMEDGIAAAVSAYELSTNGAIVVATTATGAQVYSGTDGGAALAAVFAALPATGGMISFRNDGHAFAWATTPKIPKGITSKLLICGNGATITLSTAAPTFLSVNRTADYDTIQNVEIRDFVVDRNNVATALSGAPVVLGVGTVLGVQRLNWNNITVRCIRTLNVPTNAGSSFMNRNLEIISYHQNAAEGTQTSITNVLIEDCDFMHGGNYGVLVAGFCVNANNCNCFVDNIRVYRVDHDTLTLNATASLRGDVAVHLVGSGFGGSATIKDCTSNRSGDPGFEIDSCRTLLVENCYSTDARSAGFFLINFQSCDDPAEQVAEFRNCHSRIVNYDVTKNKFNTGFTLGGGSDYGTIKLKDCSVHSKQTVFFSGDNTAGWAAQCTSAVARIEVDGFEMVMGDVADATTALTFVYGMFLWPNSDCEISLKNIRVYRAGTIGTGIRERLISIGASTNAGWTMGLDVDKITYHLAQTGGTTATTLWLFAIDNSPSNYTLRNARIRRLKCRAYSASDTNPVGLFVGGQTSVTVSKQIRVSDLDFSKLSGLNSVTFNATGGSNATLTSIVGQVQGTYPIAPVAVSVGASPFVWQNTLGYPAKLFVYSGAVSDISWSQDGSTYTSIAAASPCGPILMDSGDYVQVTYTVAPTMRACQVK